MEPYDIYDMIDIIDMIDDSYIDREELTSEDLELAASE